MSDSDDPAFPDPEQLRANFLEDKMSVPPSKPPTSKPPMKMPTKPGVAKPAARAAKAFSVKPWTDADEGEKILMYGKSGIGKTTLAAMAPGAIFIGIDDGGRKIRNPLTGEPVMAVSGIADFQDIRDAIHQSSLWPKDCTLVIDTVTKLEELMEPYIFEHYKLSGGQTATSMRKYGWDGPAHLLECYRLMLSDLDALVRTGRNVILLAQLAQITVANAEGLDYLEDGPKLQHNKQYSVRTELCEWSDHVFRIGYSEFTVEKDNDKAKAGKVQAGESKRAVFTGGASHFIAKSRPVDGYRIPPLITFDSATDNSLWQFVFEGARVE